MKIIVAFFAYPFVIFFSPKEISDLSKMAGDHKYSSQIFTKTETVCWVPVEEFRLRFLNLRTLQNEHIAVRILNHIHTENIDNHS